MTMTQLIVATLALTLIHIWFVPAFFNRVHLKYLMGSRDEGLELSVGAGRASRAATNFQESLVPFLAMCLLAMINGVDLLVLAQVWLGLRVVYLVCYVGGINPARSYVWVASLVVLILMAIKLV
ncbi:MAG: MAPEG family protein [Proteobacteria bacterium]|nr:MAPEG family protein [Pseudomonadota bacterium]MDA0897077.1 MAPEG family protein [Pseudomonadota bacterium]MDA1245156.1 MAPEG family protein [Pseudomonadota bacterium]